MLGEKIKRDATGTGNLALQVYIADAKHTNTVDFLLKTPRRSFQMENFFNIFREIKFI